MTENRESTATKASSPDTEAAPVPVEARPALEHELDPERLAKFAIEQPLDYELPVTEGD